MASFDYSNLSPMDFERLSRDLLQAEEGVTFESFKNGRDGGIDFRYARGAANEIIQCKNYEKTGLAGLIRELKSESEKFEYLKPSRYIIFTSVGLSPKNKSDIALIFNGAVSPSDIFGRDDIDNLLEKHSNILKSHFKLWLASTAVLERVLHNATLTQSSLDVHRIYRDVKRYVHNAAFPRAEDILANEGTVIISGAPGVGKTTLARMLLYAHLEADFEVISIDRSAHEAKALFNPEKKQIFYFDDFLGATFLGQRDDFVGHNEDRAILDLIEIVSESQRSRLVLTTREHILNQANIQSERFANSNISSQKCTLRIGDYSRFQRAEILYNHVYFSDLQPEYINEIIKDRFYINIVDHRKFSPRLIEWLSSDKRLNDVPLQEYRIFIEKLLDNPAEIWSHAYHRQISDAGRSALLALYSCNGSSKASNLEAAFWRLHAGRSQKYGFKNLPGDFRHALRELSGSFIKISDSIDVIDPSVLDVLNEILERENQNALDIIRYAVHFRQQRRVISLASQTSLNRLAEAIRKASADLVKFIEPLLDGAGNETTQAYSDSHEDIEGLIVLLLDAGKKISAPPIINLGEKLATSFIMDRERPASSAGSGIQLFRAIQKLSLDISVEKEILLSTLFEKIAARTIKKCSSDDLLDLISASQHVSSNIDTVHLIKLSAETYRSTGFYKDLGECNSNSEFLALKENLEMLNVETDFDFFAALQTVESDHDDFRSRESDYEDYMQDQWKEDWREQRQEDSQLDNLFGSLRPRG